MDETMSREEARDIAQDLADALKYSLGATDVPGARSRRKPHCGPIPIKAGEMVSIDPQTNIMTPVIPFEDKIKRLVELAVSGRLEEYSLVQNDDILTAVSNLLDEEKRRKDNLATEMYEEGFENGLMAMHKRIDDEICNGIPMTGRQHEIYQSIMKKVKG